MTFWQREKHRILASLILTAVFILFLAVIWRQHGEIERLEKKIETVASIIDENNELKAKVVELSERCGDLGENPKVK